MMVGIFDLSRLMLVVLHSGSSIRALSEYLIAEHCVVEGEDLFALTLFYFSNSTRNDFRLHLLSFFSGFTSVAGSIFPCERDKG